MKEYVYPIIEIVIIGKEVITESKDVFEDDVYE